MAGKESKLERKTEPKKKEAAAGPRPPAGRGAGRMLIFKNPDKVGGGASGREDWLPTWPFRMLLTGPPASGKRNALLNVVTRLDPPPDRIIVVHLDKDTKEYDILTDKR